MDNQFSIASIELSFEAFSQMNKNISDTITCAEFDPFSKDIDEVETVGIPNY
jgi:hypothetical protein